MKKILCALMLITFSGLSYAASDTGRVDEVTLTDSSGWTAYFTLTDCSGGSCSSDYTTCVTNHNGIKFGTTNEIVYATLMAAQASARIIDVEYDSSCDISKLTIE